MPTRVAALFNVPLLPRVAFRARRIGNQVDRDAVVVAGSLGTLAPLRLQHE